MKEKRYKKKEKKKKRKREKEKKRKEKREKTINYFIIKYLNFFSFFLSRILVFNSEILRYLLAVF
jgi:hypothetical protein